MKDGIARELFLFFGVVLLALGIFGAARLVVNLALFEKYPMEGVIPSNILIGSGNFFPTFQKESDCATANYPYYNPDGSVRPLTPEEEKANSAGEERCLKSIAEDRTRAKNNDIAQVAFLTLVGGGLLLARKRIR